MLLALLEQEGDSHGNWSLSCGPHSSCSLNPARQPQVPILLCCDLGEIPPCHLSLLIWSMGLPRKLEAPASSLAI